DKTLNNAGCQQREGQPDRDRNERPAVLRQSLNSRAMARRDHRPKNHETSSARHKHRIKFKLTVRGDVEKKYVELVVLRHQRTRKPNILCILKQKVWNKNTDNPKRNALSSQPRVVRPHQRGERALSVF